MTTYVDSSAVVPVYVPEHFSVVARQVLRRFPQVPYTPLHELEVGNAFALLRGRRLITADEYAAVLAHVRDDIDAQRFVSVAPDWVEVFAVACELSLAHTPRLLTRSLDLMHVAAARTLGCRQFVSADDRQLSAAKAAGLKIVDIKRRAPLRRR